MNSSNIDRRNSIHRSRVLRSLVYGAMFFACFALAPKAQPDTDNSFATAYAVFAPRPEYPYEAYSRRVTGSGVALLTVEPANGNVINITMEQSIGNATLDGSTARAFRRWRFKPGTPRKVRIPIRFLLTGASASF